jgi:hypothetical protein
MQNNSLKVCVEKKKLMTKFLCVLLLVFVGDSFLQDKNVILFKS